MASDASNVSATARARDAKREAQQETLLRIYIEKGSVRLACAAAGINRRTHARWMDERPEYADAFKEATENRAEMLEEEAFRRAHDGVDKPMFFQGKLIPDAGVKEYSDTLLLALLRATNPEKYRERSEVVTTHGGSIDLRVRALKSEELDDELASMERASLSAASRKAPALGNGEPS